MEIDKHLENLEGVLSRLIDSDVFEHNPAHDINFLDVPEPDKFQSLIAVANMTFGTRMARFET